MEILRVSPSICAYPDEEYENLIVEVALPGIEKENISFQLSETGFYLKATNEDIEYIDSYSINCPVVPKKAVAKYSNGLLTVRVPYKESLEKAVNVKIE